MKTYLPYYFRKIGIVTVFLAIVISFVGGINSVEKGYVDGYNWGSKALPSDNSETPAMHYKQVISPEISNTLSWIGISMSFVGLLLYMFSREKTEDELIRKLRYQSLEKSLIITWAVAFVFLIFRDNKLDAYSILQFQLFVYVVIYLYHKEKYGIR